jgi:ankyrin repeat protein
VIAYNSGTVEELRKMTSKGFTTSQLIESIRAGRLSDVIDALDAGADIEEPDMHGTCGLPLRAACFEGNEAIVRELLVHGANPNAAASDGPSAPLRLALRRGHKEIAALLLQQGAQIPPDTAIDPSILVLEVAPLAGEADNIIEFTRTETSLATEDRHTADSFGTATNALSMDLLFLDEQDALPDFTDKPPASTG